MAYKIEIINNSLVITDTTIGVEIYDAPKSESYYNLKLLKDSAVINIYNLKNLNKRDSDIISILLSDATDSVGTPFTESTFKTFARGNLGFKTASGSSGAVNVVYNSVNYTSLDAEIKDDLVVGDLAYVNNSQGTAWLPSGLGGTYYPKGFYVWDGTIWVSDRNAIANQLELLINGKVDNSRVLTDVPLGALFTDTIYDDTTIQAEVDLNTAKVGITPIQASDITTNNTKISYTDAAQVSTNATDISTIQGEQITQDSAIALNTAKISATGTELEPTDIDTLAELNAIVTDATLIDTTDPRLSDARTPIAHTHTASDVTDFDVEVSNNLDVIANTNKVSNIDHPLVETAVPIGALFTDTIYDDSTIQAEVDLNTAKVGITPTQASNIITNNSKISYTDSTAVATNTTHRGLTNNPHNVTKSQVGLANADNTSDINKPVSTAQQSAIDSHSNSDGSSHTFINQDLRTSANVTHNGMFLNNGFLRLGRINVQILAGAITAEGSFYRVDSEGASGSDTLDTINNTSFSGAILVLMAQNNNRPITIINSNNIRLAGGVDCTLSNADSVLVLISISATVWVEISRSV